MPIPTEIVGRMRSRITLTWADGHKTEYPARELRLACRCAGCIEETSGRPMLDPATVPEDLRAKNIDLVGQYAVQIFWSDGHDTGIFNFRELRARCPCPECTERRGRGETPT